MVTWPMRFGITLLTLCLQSFPALSTQLQISNTQLPEKSTAGETQDTQGSTVKYQFNLSSAVPSILAGHHHNFQFADLIEDGQPRTIMPTDMITPAEYLSLHQILTTHKQTILLGSEGQAIGGRCKIDSDLIQAIQELALQPPSSSPHSMPSENTLKYHPHLLSNKRIIANADLRDEEYIYTDGYEREICGTVVSITSGGKRSTPKTSPSQH